MCGRLRGIRGRAKELHSDTQAWDLRQWATRNLGLRGDCCNAPVAAPLIGCTLTWSVNDTHSREGPPLGGTGYLAREVAYPCEMSQTCTLGMKRVPGCRGTSWVQNCTPMPEVIVSWTFGIAGC